MKDNHRLIRDTINPVVMQIVLSTYTKSDPR